MDNFIVATGTEAPPKIQPPPHHHIAALDGLRGCAVLLVLFHHLGSSLESEFKIRHSPLWLGRIGWSGVELFFVLSGFLITGILYDSKGKSGYFRNFYARRVLRIFPLYYAALLVFAALHWLAPLGFPLKSEGLWVWMLTYMTNVGMVWKGFGCLAHFWSLAVEEHFYLFWPLVVWSLDRRQLMRLAVAVWVISLLLRPLALFYGVSPGAVYLLTPFRLDGLLTGGFLALALRGEASGPRQFLRASGIAAACSALGLALLLVARKSVNHHDAGLQALGFSLFTVLFGSLLILSISWRPLATICSLPVLRWFGKYSYGLYVWHPIVFMLFLHTEIGRSWRVGSGMIAMASSVVLALTITFTVTLASWHALRSILLG